MNVHEKYRILQENLKNLGSVAVAFSSGVDSAFLLKAAQEALGDKVIAITASSCSFPGRELKEAKEFCVQHGIRQIICNTNELEIEGFSENPPNRCYLCKRELFGKICAIAKENGTNVVVVVEGSNMDDLGDYRPGLTAIRELGIISPLRQAGLTKSEIRELSREMGLPTWDKPSFACLSSRFAYGERITEEKLRMVENAEQFLMDKGFRQVRVRIHGKIARIEVLPSDISRIVEEKNRTEIAAKLKEYGFDYVSLDLQGYRTGSMNEVLKNKEKK